MKSAITIFWMTLILGCSDNPCIDLCQQYELYLDECGYGWSTVFSDEGWVTLDDCYDDYWEADSTVKGTCETDISEIQTLECF
tara:strand:+ start:189 stop:437 length:249 start_codon:yes stop_codon:yes gene_type:complete